MKFRYILLIVLTSVLLNGCTSMKEGISSFLIQMETKRAGLSLERVKMNDHDLAYLERNGSGPVIVLLHGFSSDKNDWIRFAGHLPEKYRIIAFDLPGHGDNTQEDFESYDPPALSDAVGRVVDAMGINKFHLAGNSLGGLVSKLYARKHPEKVITLGLFDSAGVTPKVPGDFYEALEKGENPFDVKTRNDYEVLKAYAFYNMPFIPWPMDGVMAEKRIKRNDFYQDVFEKMTVHPAFTDPVFQANLIKELSMPVMVAWGDKDRILNVSSTEVYSRYLKDKDLEIIIFKDCGHVPMIERPKESATKYAGFISKY